MYCTFVANLLLLLFAASAIEMFSRMRFEAWQTKQLVVFACRYAIYKYVNIYVYMLICVLISGCFVALLLRLIFVSVPNCFLQQLLLHWKYFRPKTHKQMNS